jgi:hypothetical protein
MYLPLVGLGVEWPAWITTILVWILLAATSIALLSWTDAKNKKVK